MGGNEEKRERERERNVALQREREEEPRVQDIDRAKGKTIAEAYGNAA